MGRDNSGCCDPSGTLDGLAKSHPLRWLRKKAKVKARESRGARRTYSTPQRQRDEAQRRDWPFYETTTLDFGPWERIFYGEFDSHRRKPALVKII
jgi:hypothetical protein